ncbi:hypothetical protein F4X10_24020 [Candidatus Poribacteria bacterium]|nr:hypothetical protein [Candidatus Poribacteria bacterium]
MAISDLVGKVFSSQFIAGVEQVTPILSLANDRSSEVQRNGDGLEIGLTQDLVTVADYPDSDNITYSNLSPTKVTMALDKKKYIAFQVEDIDRAQLAFNLFAEGARQAGVEFSKQLSADFRATFAAVASPKTFEFELAANDSTAAERQALALLIYDIKEFMSMSGYDGRPAILIHPSTYKLLIEFVTVDKPQAIQRVSDRAFVDATLSALFGIDIIVDWGAAIDANNSNDKADSWVMMRGRTLTYAGQISNIEQMRSSGRFASQWRGLQTYGSIIQETRSFVKLAQTVK